MDTLIHQISNQLKQNPTWTKSNTAILAISGGVDSMALLEVFIQLNKALEGSNKQLVVAHFDHNVREDSYLDAAFVQKKAEEAGLIYFVQKWKNPAQKDFEARARRARYRFLAEVARSMDTNIVVTGHHLNDHIETIMMRFVRGTSIRGIRGIQSEQQLPVKIDRFGKALNLHLIRPFLDVSKEELYRFAKREQINFREDSSNLNPIYYRNRVRHELMPLLEKENPNVLKNIQRLVEQANISYQSHLYDFWEEELYWLKRLNKKEWQIHIPFLEQLNSAKRCIYLTIFCEELFIKEYPQLSNDVPSLLNQMIEKEQNANYSIQLGSNWVAVREYDTIYIRQDQPTLVYSQEEIQLQTINHWYPLGEGYQLGFFQEDEVTEAMYEMADAHLTVELSADEKFDFSIRHRRAGDFMRLGTVQNPFHKKINRIMIDNKIPKSIRESKWLLLNKKDIIWLIPDTKSLLYQSQQTDTINYVFLFQPIFD